MTRPSGTHRADPDFLEALRARCAARTRTVVFPEGEDTRVHDAVADCLSKGLLRPVLVGPPAVVAAGLREAGVDPERVSIVDPMAPARIDGALERLTERREGKADTAEDLLRMASDPLFQAGVMVDSGEADGAVAGCVRTTADVVRAGLVCIGLADGIRTVSSSFYMVFGPNHPVGPLVLTFTDAGVVPRPTSAQLAEIAVSAVQARRRVVGDEPRVAFLSYSTKGSAEGEAVTAVRQALASFQAVLPDVRADGELQGDAALAPDVARRKAPGSPLSGEANVLVFPDLASANVSYKLVQHLGGAVALGPVLQGLARPFSDLSRGATASDIISVACITALMAD